MLTPLLVLSHSFTNQSLTIYIKTVILSIICLYLIKILTLDLTSAYNKNNTKAIGPLKTLFYYIRIIIYVILTIFCIQTIKINQTGYIFYLFLIIIFLNVSLTKIKLKNFFEKKFEARCYFVLSFFYYLLLIFYGFFIFIEYPQIFPMLFFALATNFLFFGLDLSEQIFKRDLKVEKIILRLPGMFYFLSLFFIGFLVLFNFLSRLYLSLFILIFLIQLIIPNKKAEFRFSCLKYRYFSILIFSIFFVFLILFKTYENFYI